MFGTIALASTLAGLAAAAPLSSRAESKSAQVYGNFSTSYFWAGEYHGSCGYTNSTKQYIASVVMSKDAKESSCGKTIKITDYDHGKTVLAQVVDEDEHAASNYLNVSRVTFQETAGKELKWGATFKASYIFVDEPVPEWVAPEDDNNNDDGNTEWTPKKQDTPAPAPKKEDSKPAAAPKKDDEKPAAAPQKQEPKQETPKKEEAPKQAEPKKDEPKKEQPKQEQPKKEEPKQEQPKKEESKPEQPKKEEPKKEQPKPSSGGGGGSFHGRATWYTQNGNAGACGSVNSDGAYIVAVNAAQYGGGSHCGSSVRISSGGKTITARVADLCPGCGYGSLDLSTGAFSALGSQSQGVLPISWSWA